MSGSASELARRLGDHAEAVCREYLSNGRRVGNYWIVGDVRNTEGRSMHVRLKTNAKGRAGKWVDEATSEYGDLLDVIRESCGLVEFRDVADEARRFLAMPRPQTQRHDAQREPAAARGSPDAARRLVREEGDELLGQQPEHRRRGPLVAEHRQLVGDQWVVRNVHSHRLKASRPADQEDP